MVAVALAYRVIDDKRYFVDLYAGGRYSYLGASASATINRAGVEALSQRIIDRAIAKLGPGLLAKYPGLKNVPASEQSNSGSRSSPTASRRNCPRAWSRTAGGSTRSWDCAGR